MKFSIRDLLLVTVIVALAVGWWADRRRMRQEVRREVDRVYSVLENRAAALNPPQK
jgi:lipopolysaccharide biosynthesis regulator YciM